MSGQKGREGPRRDALAPLAVVREEQGRKRSCSCKKGSCVKTVHASNKRFQEELKKFMADHMRRKALVQRLMKAGLFEDK
jgi:hypothetical protein